MKAIPTVFMGSDPIALPLLEALLAMADMLRLVGIWTQPDKPRGRGLHCEANIVKSWALDHHLEVHQPSKIQSADLDWLRQRQIELILVMAYGHILPEDLLRLPKYPPLNFHASLLPVLRGASPIQAAIAEGLAETGVTLMQIVRKLDAGPILAQRAVPLTPTDHAPALAEKLARACASLVEQDLPRFLRGELMPTPQDDSRATYTRLLEKEDALLDFRRSARILANRSRALCPWPGTAFRWEDDMIKSDRVSASDEQVSASPGTVLEDPCGKTLRVACAEGVLAFHTLQRPGGKMLSSADFLRGYPIPPGTQLALVEMKPLTDHKPFSRTRK